MLQNVEIDQVETAMRKEMECPGKLFGYRALHKKLSVFVFYNAIH